jgi:oligopeptide transport system ATP-binding protein
MALLQSLPRLGRTRTEGDRLRAIPGNVPNPMSLPPGCAFHPRCGFFEAGRCDTREPPFDAVDRERGVRCLRWREIAGAS